MKRVFDLVLSLPMLFFLLPVFLVISVAILLTSPGGVFYFSNRVGRFGKPFKMYKFRSMVPDADQIGSYQTAVGDPRITRVGRILRKTSLDELPQILNVIFGDMSLVGPRPDVADQKSSYSEEEWNKRNSVKPGITGLAQATLRSDVTWEQRRALDFEYIDNMSFWMDIKILFLTVNQVIRKGSH